MKRCSCGRRYDEAGWAALPLVGRITYEHDDGQESARETLEHRNCPCGSTMAVEVEDER